MERKVCVVTGSSSGIGAATARLYAERGWNVVRYQWRGLITRAGTPQPIVERLAAAVQRVQQGAEWKAFLRQESQLDGFQGPDAFQAQIAQDRQEIEALKKRLGL